jgi:hypothetical protein
MTSNLSQRHSRLCAVDRSTTARSILSTAVTLCYTSRVTQVTLCDSDLPLRRTDQQTSDLFCLSDNRNKNDLLFNKLVTLCARRYLASRVATLHKPHYPKLVSSTDDQNRAVLLLAYLPIFLALRNNAQRAASRASEPLLTVLSVFWDHRFSLLGCLATNEYKGGSGHRLRVCRY